MNKTEQYRVFELKTQPNETVVFTQGQQKYCVPSFDDGESRLVRFAPQTTGCWQYTSKKESGTLECVPAKQGNHGLVRADGFHFRYDDGKPYLPFGTTLYAWIHQDKKLIEQTVESLKNAPFNKVRMCVFPKSMAYNNNEPQDFPFEKENGVWNVHKPVPSFWRRLDLAIMTLDALSIEAELILFHPYDRWGFAELTREQNLAYVDYCIRRLSAYKNVWWSLANEYELCLQKTQDDWDSFGQKLRADDIYRHPISVHDFCAPYPKREWMSHASIQSAYTARALLWRSMYKMPVINDECGYEGDLEFGWGNLSGFELVHRMWTGMVNGSYCTHGETLIHPDEVVWWAKGGKLQGESIARIAFLKTIFESLPGSVNPVIDLDAVGTDAAVAGQGTPFMRALAVVSDAERAQITVDMIPLFCGNENCRLYYYGRGCPRTADVAAPGNGKYRVEIIDVWEMKRTNAGEMQGTHKVALPAKEGMAILLTKI